MKLVVLLKLSENFLRGLFLIFVTYSLSLSESGYFGIFVSLVTITAYLVSFEKRIEFQREMVNKNLNEVINRILQLIAFFCINFLILIPLFYAIIYYYFELPFLYSLFIFCIIFSEVIFNQAYQFSLIRKELYFIQLMNLIRFFIIFIFTIYVFIASNQITLEMIILIWSCISILALLISFIFLYMISINNSSSFNFINIFSEYKISISHFFFGFFSMLLLTIDRLILDQFLDIEELGIFFRNIVIFSIFLQFFNIALVNRVTPLIFDLCKKQKFKKIDSIVFKELFNGVALISVYVLVLGGLYPYFLEFNIVFQYQVILSLALVFRLILDFFSVIFLGLRYEQVLLKLVIMQIIFLPFLLTFLTLEFSILGSFLGILILNVVFFLTYFIIYQGKLKNEKNFNL